MSQQFERDLRESLRRREAPAGFADKVLARTRETEKRPSRQWQWLAAAAIVVLMIGGGVFVREQQRRQAEAHKEQLMVALRITGSKLRLAQSKLSRIQLPTIEVPSQD